MEIKIKIKSCNDCRHLSHSGAFTPGGAKPVCDHDKAIPTKEEIGSKRWGGKITKDLYHWKNRVIPYKCVYNEIFLDKKTRVPYKIPDWCPLKQGFDY